MRYAYFYFMRPEPQRIREVARAHAAYWRGLALREYQGGPFADRTGGLITFDHDSEREARRLVDGDPFREADLLASHWLKAWSVE